MKLLGRSHLVAFAAITIMAVGVGAALANTQHHQPPVARQACTGRMGRARRRRSQRNKATVVAYYTTAFNDKKPEEAVAKYGGPVYIQHNPQAADGFDAFIAFVKFFTAQNPQLHVDIKRVIGECNMVVTHSHITLSPSDRGSGGGRHLPPQPPGQGRRALGRDPARARDLGERQHDVLIAPRSRAGRHRRGLRQAAWVSGRRSAAQSASTTASNASECSCAISARMCAMWSGYPRGRGG